jgi:type I restriction enzyme M protein
MVRDRESDLKECLLHAADILSPTMHSSEYKYYVFPILFLRFLSDIDPAAHQYAELFESELCGNIGVTIDNLLADVEERFPDQLGGVLRGVEFSDNRLGNRDYGEKILRDLVSCFSPHRLSRDTLGSDQKVLGALFSMAIVFLASSSKEGGEYVTPAEVSHLLASLLAHEHGEDFYDPACGSGTLLLASLREAAKVSDVLPRAFGQERNGAAWSLAKMSFFLTGWNTSNIVHGNSIHSPLTLPDGTLRKFDVVISNPPWSTSNWGWEHAKNDPFGRFDLGLPPKSNGDFAFILHMLSTLKPNGRMAVLVSNGTLSRGGSEAGIRQRLLKRGLIDTVIALPPKLFFNTNIATNLLVLRASPQTSDVLFIDASGEFEPFKGRNRLTELGINRAVEVFRNRSSDLPFSALVGLDEFDDEIVDLNVRRFVKAKLDTVKINLAQLRMRSHAIQDELTALDAELANVLKMIECR